MSNGYRVIIVAVGGIALFVALSIGAYVGSLYSPDHKQYQAVASDQSRQGDYQGPSQSLSDISGLPSPVERAIANNRPDTGQDHEKRDLAAQEASALWAFYMVVASFASVLITAVGTAFLYKQIVLTREAVEDTGRATEAMNRQNEIAKEVHRPWITISAEPKYFLAASSHHFDTEFTFHNVGDTAALSLNFVVNIIYESPETEGQFWDIFESAEVEAHQSKICVVPRDKYIYQISFPVEPKDIRYWAEPSIINPVMIVTAFYKSDTNQTGWHKAIRCYRWIRKMGGSLSVEFGRNIDGSEFVLRPQGGHVAT